jgi:DNA primase
VQRGLSPPVIWNHQLGWNGSRITIPIFNRKNQLAFFKLARSPEGAGDEPKMLCWPAGECSAELYGWEHLRSARPARLVICEGEFDRLVLESRGIPAVTGTAGALVFPELWVKVLAAVPELFICFDRDDAGRTGARRVASLLPHARIVELPEAVGPGGDISDLLVRLGRSVGEFRMLLADAKPLPEGERTPPSRLVESPLASNPARPGDLRLERIKAALPIEVIARQYVSFRSSGRTLVGKCIFHCDSQPSLVLYPDHGRFYCYGCGAHGDVIQFLMEAECWDLPRALRELERYLASLAP